jgi:hypothetical protein
MKRPSFQFYPADWRNNAKLRRCSEAARGVWMDILCVLHDSDEYGIVRWPLDELARVAGSPPKLVNELILKEVLKGADKGKRCDPLIFTPRHSRKVGDPVTLIPSQMGPIWYSSRFVVDEYKRQTTGAATRFGTKEQHPKDTEGHTNPPQGGAPSNAPSRREGAEQGDGSTSTSTSTSFNYPVPRGGSSQVNLETGEITQ